MTLDQIIDELRTSDLPPDKALHAAVGHADTLAPVVYKQAERFCRGICLQQGDENLLLYGVHVLAAARHPELWPHLVAMCRVPDDEIDQQFHHHASTSLTALMLSVWDGDADALFRLIEHAELGDSGRCALFDLLARLTFDGKVARPATAAFLERYEQEALADDDSGSWWGWEGAVTKLGLTDLEPALRRAWEKPAFAETLDTDKTDALAELAAAAAAPADATAFETSGLAAVTDPFAALDWMLRQEAFFKTLDATDGSDQPPAADDDPARTVRLTDEETYWFSRFLASRQVPVTTMPLEMLDGYLTALAIGPLPTDPIAEAKAVWSEDGSEQPAWQDDDDAAHVAGLIKRMVEAISIRRRARALHAPVCFDGDEAIGAAAAWADGFAAGVDQRDDAWSKLFEDRNGAEDGLAIIALCDNETEYFGRPATIKERQQIIERLPVILQRLAAYWDDPAKGYPRPQPIKVEKIGRNDPCHCGSGLKYKKCCGK